ncbi:group I intron-associated PD-(D/E)XK endonuclease [Haloferax namakaokahaiae]|uniref:Group I intron-associated PD-(D/E)XK endonuclease n=1 Tax=Haloferax namakaokahaiae TaxID=1748331 RepID=A0ABD5ZH02_9EURY
MHKDAFYFDQLGETHLRGQAAEAIVKAAFLRRGIPVLVPEYDNEPYDLVIQLGDEFLRLQVKTGYDSNEGTVTFETVSTRSRANGYERSHYEDAIDYFAVYSPEVEQTYLVHIDDAASGKMQLRYEPPANNQRIGINWHEDYALDAVLSKLYDKPTARSD